MGSGVTKRKSAGPSPPIWIFMGRLGSTAIWLSPSHPRSTGWEKDCIFMR